MIELLVVIAIVAVLAALLLPALARARAVAKMANCANNLHQSAIAINLYADDYRCYPYTTKDCLRFNPITVGCTGLDNGATTCSPANDDGGMWAQTQLDPHALGPYVNGPFANSLCCPSRFEVDSGYRHYLGRPYLSAMYFANYHLGGCTTSTGVINPYSTTWAPACTTNFSLTGCSSHTAIASCNTRATAFSGQSGHTTHRWGWCAKYGHFNTAHNLRQSLCDQNNPVNILVLDGSVQRVVGQTAP